MKPCRCTYPERNTARCRKDQWSEAQRPRTNWRQHNRRERRVDDWTTGRERVGCGTRWGGDDEPVRDGLGEVLSVDEGVDGVEVGRSASV